MLCDKTVYKTLHTKNTFQSLLIYKCYIYSLEGNVHYQRQLLTYSYVFLPLNLAKREDFDESVKKIKTHKATTGLIITTENDTSCTLENQEILYKK